MRASNSIASRLHFRHLFRLHLVELAQKDKIGIFQNRFDEGEQIERVGFARAIEELGRLEQVKRQRVVEGEIVLQLGVHDDAVSGRDLDDARVEKRFEHLQRRAPDRALSRLGSWRPG